MNRKTNNNLPVLLLNLQHLDCSWDQKPDTWKKCCINASPYGSYYHQSKNSFCQSKRCFNQLYFLLLELYIASAEAIIAFAFSKVSVRRHWVSYFRTWVWNCILNEKTLSLDSVRGTCINSKKNCCEELQRNHSSYIMMLHHWRRLNPSTW